MNMEDALTIKREQDVTHLIGNIVYDIGNCCIRKITGNNAMNGFVEFEGCSTYWIGFDSLKESIRVNDITGLGVRKALWMIRKDTHQRCITYRLNQKWIKAEIARAEARAKCE